MLTESNIPAYSDIYEHFYRSWGDYIPYKDDYTKQAVKNFSDLLANILAQAASEALILASADRFLEEIELNYSQTEFKRIKKTLELFCDFSVSRRILEQNPFRPVHIPMAQNLPIINGSRDEELPVINLDNQHTVVTNIYEDKFNSIKDQLKDTPAKEISYDLLRNLLRKQLDDRYTNDEISKNTYRKYYRDNLEFIDFLDTNKLDFSVDSIKLYVKHLKTIVVEKPSKSSSTSKDEKDNVHKLWKSTIACKKTSVRSFLVNLEADEDMKFKGNYRKALKVKANAKVPMLRHRSLTLQEIESIMYVIANLSLQEQLEIILSILAGGRPEEMTLLKVLNIHFATRRIFFAETKGSKERYVAVPLQLLEMIKKHIENGGLSDTDYLFPSRQCEHMSTRTLQNHLQKIIKSTNIKRSVTPHDLRATFAYLQYYHTNEKERDLIKLSKLMGHSKLDQTSDYIGDRFEDDNYQSLTSLIEFWFSIISKKATPLDKFHKKVSFLAQNKISPKVIAV